MDEEFNIFNIEGTDGSFDPSPENAPVSDETEAKEVYDYQDLTRYAAAGKAVSRGIIGLATAGIVTGGILGLTGVGGASAEDASIAIEPLVIKALEDEDAIAYSFTVSGIQDTPLWFCVSSPVKAERFEIHKDGSYDGVVRGLGYESEVVWSFVLDSENGDPATLKEGSLTLVPVTKGAMHE